MVIVFFLFFFFVSWWISSTPYIRSWGLVSLHGHPWPSILWIDRDQSINTHISWLSIISVSKDTAHATRVSNNSPANRKDLMFKLQGYTSECSLSRCSSILPSKQNTKTWLPLVFRAIPAPLTHVWPETYYLIESRKASSGPVHRGQKKEAPGY